MTQPPQDYYEGYWAKGLDHWSPHDTALTALEERLLATYAPPGSKVLDFGCGDGARLGAFLVSTQRSYVGVDVSQSAVEACKSRGLQAFRCVPDTPLPFEEATFDVILGFEVLEHLFSPARSATEIRRLLRPGGYFVGSVPNVVVIGNRLLMAFGYFNPGGSPATSLKKPWLDPHIRFFSKASLGHFLREAGFRTLRICGADLSPGQFPVLYRQATRGKAMLERLSKPIGAIGRWWPSLFSHRLYFAAQK